ncbi:Histidine kinase [Pedobacter westerhofensis]|uniref:Histidine kinase n=1 Tax=Pedobacter westerhofensis TaxID=425512 RepID=A0A521AJT0_9SPHI|nr:histidine kinase [Pedobacter westerhofensis]SMO35066.1 Histidine kinase [Pedobacter westerhofensis]
MRESESVSVTGKHLIFWLLYISYIIVTEGWTESDNWTFRIAPQAIVNLLTGIILVYVNLNLLMPAFYTRGRYLSYAASLFTLLLAGGLFIRFISYSLFIPMEHSRNPLSWQPTNFWITARIFKDVLEVIPVVTITMVLKLMRDSHQREIRLRATENEKYNAEINMLKGQMNPHFFFNTLNSLYSLSLNASPDSPKMIMNLSNLMRYILYEAANDKVPLIKDLNHISNYLEIENMRFGDRLELSAQSSGDIGGQWIAPLLLLPFIENAFKHGIEDGSGWITIDVKVAGKRLYLRVENSFPQILHTKQSGIGLKNVRRRLDLLYPLRHTLLVSQQKDSYKVDLKIDL